MVLYLAVCVFVCVRYVRRNGMSRRLGDAPHHDDKDMDLEFEADPNALQVRCGVISQANWRQHVQGKHASACRY